MYEYLSFKKCFEKGSHLDLEMLCHGFSGPGATSSFLSFTSMKPLLCLLRDPMAAALRGLVRQHEHLLRPPPQKPVGETAAASWEVGWTPPPRADTFLPNRFPANGGDCSENTLQVFFYRSEVGYCLNICSSFPVSDLQNSC